MTRTPMLKATTVVLLLTAGAAYADSHATHPETGKRLATDQSFTYRVADDSPSIDPGLVEDVDGLKVVRDLFEGLMSQDADGNLIPGVATGFTISEDQLIYTFTLRDTAKWSNGDPVTAHDFVYAWRRAASPALASPYAWYIDLMSLANGSAVIAGDMPSEALGVKAVDDLTFEVTLSQPLPYFTQMVVHATTFPVHEATVEAYGVDWTKPENIVSNGAYMLSEIIPQEQLTRTRNIMYWDDENTIIDRVTALVIADEDTALTRYLAGELDQTDVPAGQYPRLLTDYPDQAVSVPEACTYYYTINMTETANPALLDPNVRMALSLAIDRDVIVENVLAGGQKPAFTFTHWATAGFETPDIAAASMTQDARNARAVDLIAEAGFDADNPLDLNLIYNTNDTHQSVAIAISRMWHETLGVQTELADQDWQKFLDTRSANAFEIARSGWCATYNEASTFLDLMGTGADHNDAGYSNPRVDALLAAAKTSPDPQASYTEIETIIATDLPIIPIFHYAAVDMYASDLGGVPYNNVQQNWYSRDLYKIAE